jgi:hypothetical protein
MKSSFSFKLANVSVPMVEANIGEIAVAAEVEYTPEEFLELVRQAGTFYEWLGEKAEPIIAMGIAQVMAQMEKNAADSSAEQSSGRWQVYCREDTDAEGNPGRYMRATRRTFGTEDEAQRYASGINPDREPFVTAAPFDESPLP